MYSDNAIAQTRHIHGTYVYVRFRKCTYTSVHFRICTDTSVHGIYMVHTTFGSIYKSVLVTDVYVHVHTSIYWFSRI
jgi:hypothetical protein